MKRSNSESKLSWWDIFLWVFDAQEHGPQVRFGEICYLCALICIIGVILAALFAPNLFAIVMLVAVTTYMLAGRIYLKRRLAQINTNMNDQV